jgi:PAS domain S-box-containing protein
VLISGAADHLAALVARAAEAPIGLIYFVDGDRLRRYGGYGPAGDDTLLSGTLAGMVQTGTSLIVSDPELPGAYVAQPVRNETGAVLGICCAFDPEPRHWTAGQIAAVDEAAQVGTLLITEQLARHEIDRQRRFLDAVLDSLHDGVTACDADGRIVLANARIRRLWGSAAPADLTGDAGSALNRDDLALLRALHGEQVRDEELVLTAPNGHIRHYLVDAQPIVGPDGGTLGAVQAVQDVTRRRRAERFRTCELAVTTALAEAPSIEAAGPRVLEAVGSTLDWTHAELWLVDETAGVIRAAARWSAVGRQSDMCTPPDLTYGQGLAGRAWQVDKPLWIRDVGQPQSLISQETAASGRLHTALAIPVRHGPEPLGVLTAFADTIEDPEDEVVALMSGIAAHIGQFVERRLVEDLQRQLARSENEYLALVGHEMRTPLTAISAYTEILRESDPAVLAADGPALLEVIERNTAQLRHIIDELLALSALDTGHVTVQTTPVDLAEVVREAVACTRAAIDGGPLSLDAQLPGVLVVPGDRRLLRQTIDNLIGNAVKYSPDGGRISVSLRPAGRTAELIVSDTGIGVAPEEREKLFSRLYRSSKVRDRAIPGTGLGLALSRAVVHRHHGTIELAERDGPGTTVVLRLPLDAR